jgi:hypothetical protein
MGVNYGVNRLRFTAPVPVGSRPSGRPPAPSVLPRPPDTVHAAPSPSPVRAAAPARGGVPAGRSAEQRVMIVRRISMAGNS